MLPAYEDPKRKRLAAVLLLGACLVIFSAASEVRYPVVSVGFVSFTISELMAGLFVLATIAWAAVDRGRFFSWRVLDLAVALFLASNFLSVAAAADKPSALKFALRMTFAALVYLGISRLPSRARSHLVVAGAAAATLGLVTIVGLLEAYVRSVDWASLLSPWHEGIITFGTFFNLRVSSILPYPTTLSMYLELVFPLALAAGLWLVSRQAGSARKALLSTGIIAGTAAVMLVQMNTYTRTALVAGPVSLLMAAALALLFGYGRRVAAFFALPAAILILILAGSATINNTTATRLGLAEQERIYGAEYTLLDLPNDLKPGGQYTARVRLKNTSDVFWDTEGSEGVTVYFFWFSYPEREMEPEIPYFETDLPKEVAPGESLDMDIGFRTPEAPGRYILLLDLITGGVGSFSSVGVPSLMIPLELDRSGFHRFTLLDENESDEVAVPAPSSPTRRQLWLAALKAWRAHPLLGMGPDQFRKHYAEYMPELEQDDRVGANNIFLEALANTGPLGLAAMVFLLGTAGWRGLQLVRDRSLNRSCRLISLGLLSALAAYVLHGLLDYFLWQTGIAFMFFTELGLISWIYQKREAGRDVDAIGATEREPLDSVTASETEPDAVGATERQPLNA